MLGPRSGITDGRDIDLIGELYLIQERYLSPKGWPFRAVPTQKELRHASVFVPREHADQSLLPFRLARKIGLIVFRYFE